MIFRNHFLKKGKMSEVLVPKIGKTQGTMFAYSWHLDDEQQEVTVIRIYGLNEKNENVCLIVSNFTPYVYIELPYNIDWDNSKAQLVASKIDSLMGDKKPLVKCLMFKKRLYYASKRLFPYLFCSFSSTQDIRQLSYRINKPLSVPGLGYLPLKIHESNASPILQLVSNRQIPTAGWISFLGKKSGTTEGGLTHCTHEYSVSWKDLSPVSSNNVANPLIMSFDLEVNSSVPTSMPNADRPEDKIFQISAILGRQGSKQETYQKFIISLGNPNPEFLEKNITIIPCKTEEELLMAYTDLLQKYQPNIVIGYNIFGFDIPYMIARAKLTYCIYDFDKQGMYRYSHAKEKTIEWSSSAYKNQSFQFLDVEGRIFVDLLPIVKRDYKMSNYKLSTISAHFLGGQTKDPLDARGIFKCYKLGMKGDAVGRKALSVCAKYCVQDSFLVLRLFEVLTTWVALCEMSKVTNVQIFSLFTQGQQLKVFSQVYKKCTHENTVVERNAYIAKSDDHYVGATVFPPVPGIYDKVVPFDFSSLYPTTIIANNISWDTFVQDDSIPDSECHVMSWDDHISCIMEGTMITVGENSVPIEKLLNYRGNVLGYDDENNGLSNFPQTNFFNRGVKECIELTFEDGTKLCCTPDHRILLSDNRWVEAQNILLEKDRVSVGYCPPYYNVDGQEVIIDTLVLSGRRLINFYKILGLLITDGHVVKNRTVVYFGHELDGKNLVSDINELMPNSTSVHKTSYCWGITILGKLGEIFRNLEGIVWGSKKGKRKFPTLLKYVSIPELRAFLSGLFGGGGHTLSYSVQAKTIGNISLSWTGTEEELRDTFTELQGYLKKCDINSTIIRQGDKYTFLHIMTSDTLKFYETIGFSYCVHKSTRLEAGCSYLRLRENVWNQQKWIIDRVRELKKYKSVQEAVDQAKQELRTNQPIYNHYYTNPSKSQIIELMRTRRKNIKCMFSKEYFPFPKEYMKSIGAEFLFCSYSVPRGQNVLPRLHKKVIYVRNIGKQQVYDIEVAKSHSFVANGIIVHNCSHDPKEIRKKEIIELLKKQDVILKELRAERDKKSNKNRKEEIKEQIAEHIRKTKPLRDEKSALMKSKPKHIICAQRRYRWLKAPMGVLPEILSDLLKSRASTKKELKAVKAQLKTMKEGSPEYIEKSVYADVLDQRQNALKISANSGYGILGTKTGYLPLMTGAMCTTFRGRKSIEMAAESIQKDYGGVLVYGDSVTADTPILVKYPNGSINIQTIDTLGEEWVSYDSFKQGEDGLNDKEQSSCNLSVWTSKNGVGKWSKINRVIRHKTNKKLYRVLTHTGCVDVTEDHSLLRENGEQVKPTDLKVGESLLHSFPYSFEEFDTTIVEGVNKGISKTYDLKGYEAFVWGTFLGCGSSTSSSNPVSKIENTTWQLVAKERKKFRVVHKYLSILEPKIKFVVKLEKTYYILVPTGDKEDIKLFTEKYRQLFYDTKRHCTIVPYPIFNTTKNNKELFIHGYMYGCSSYSFPIISLENKLVAQGLYVLLKSVGKNMYISLSDVDTYRLIENKEEYKTEYQRERNTAIKKILPLPETKYTEYVYDLETESGVFHAGIGELILKNTDSNYVSFPELKTAQECWDYSVKVASEVSKLFPPPMSLAFEEKIYWRFFILTKKRYMSLECDREGKLKKEISKKGVLLQRRDNCAYVRKVYGDVVMMLFNKETMDNIFYYIIEEINKLCGNFYPVKDFIVTKSIGTVSNLDDPVEGKDKKGKTCYKCGDYTVKKLPEDEKKREAQFRLKDCSAKEDYYLRSLPAIAQLAEKMRGRGELVSAGSRIEYLITTTGGHKAKQYVKVEDSEYFARHRESLDIDYMYYLKQLATPLDQVLDIFLKESEKGFVMNQYKYRLTTRTNMLEELKSLFSYKIVLKK